MSENILQLSDNTFDEEVGLADEPIVVDFWAEWCGPCRQLTPVLDQVATEMAGKLRVAKLNVDDNPKVTQRFEVMSIPTLILFKNGVATARITGAKSKGALISDLSAYLEADA